MNFFIPSTKLIRKERRGSALSNSMIFHRLRSNVSSKLPCSLVKQKKGLHNLHASLNPFLLQQLVSKKIKALLAQADPLPRYVANDPRSP